MQAKLSVWQRLTAPTPKFFQKIRNIGIVAGAVGTALLAQPIELPGFVSTIATYLILAGTITSIISQAAVDNSKIGE
jgi:ABC-type xylose transport system permease subunit